MTFIFISQVFIPLIEKKGHRQHIMALCEEKVLLQKFWIYLSCLILCALTDDRCLFIIPSFIFWTGSSLADINLGLIRYVLHEETVQETMDNFKFLVKDSKPNVVSDNVFHIQWSLISFEHKRLPFFYPFLLW